MTEQPLLQARTLTGLWTFSQYVYKIAGLSLLIPISQAAAKWTLAVFVPSWVLLALLGVGWQQAGLTAHFVLPGLITWLALRSSSDGGRPVDSARSWLTFGWSALRSRDPRPVRLADSHRVG